VHGRQILTVHLDIEEGLPLEEAHAKASAFEQAVAEAFPDFEQVWTHLEPVQRQSSDAHEADFYHNKKIEQIIKSLPDVTGVACDIHEITLLMEKNCLNISFHCMLHGDISIEKAHELSERMETVLRAKISNVDSVFIHMEPREEGESKT
jgi:divalent metal cation (Fe/Co/Zn/Cd) transporter